MTQHTNIVAAAAVMSKTYMVCSWRLLLLL